MERLAGRLALVAIVSGRQAHDARDLIGLEHLLYVGNHGAELLQGSELRRSPAAEARRAAVTAVLSEVAERLAIPGMRIEDKGETGSIHYRNAADPPAARMAILKALGNVSSADAIRAEDGRLVVNVLPRGAPTKGTAVRELCERYGLHGAVYVGDDRTDMAAFEALRRWRGGDRDGLAVGVLSPEAPSGLADLADVTVRGTGEVEALLLELVKILPETPSR